MPRLSKIKRRIKQRQARGASGGGSLVTRAAVGDEATQIAELLLCQPEAFDDDRGVAALRSSLRPIFKLNEDGRPITDVFIEKRATVFLAVFNANEAMLGGLRFAA